jgi:transcriptional regulator with XRE-family HTH domain
MSAVRILTETQDTVTISRDDWMRLQQELEDAEDRAAVTERRSHEQRLGKLSARRDYLTADEAARLLDGVNPVKVWREKRGLSQRSLAAEAKIGNSYLAEIETSHKPGSDDAYRKLAAALGTSPDDLDNRKWQMRQPNYGPVLLSVKLGSISVAEGQRGAVPERKRFPTLGAALRYARRAWSQLKAGEAWITDANHYPIYTVEELRREMAG